MKVDLRGKVFVVTGSSRGIGRELVRQLASEGAKVVINYNTHEKDAYNLHLELRQKHLTSIVVKADITNEKDVIHLVSTVLEEYKTIDGLINNAGINSDSEITEMTYSEWNDVLMTDLSSVFLCAKYVGKAMIKQKQGKIINIASYKGQIGCEKQANYCAAKGGVISLTKSLAKEFSKYKISVNSICPGFIVTDLNRNNPEKISIAKSKSYLGIERNLETLLNMITFMLSDNFINITGQNFNLDSRMI